MRARLTVLAALFLLLPPPRTAQINAQASADVPARVMVRTVRFTGGTHVAPATLEQIAAGFRGRSFDNRAWLNGLEDRVRGAEQRKGYFLSDIEAIPELRVGSASREVDVVVNIEEGEPYRPSPTVRNVRFRGKTHVPPATLGKIAARYRGKPIDDPTWPRELSDRVRDAEQQQGYFPCRAEAEQELVVGKSGRQYAIATVSIEEGAQYRLKSISITRAKACPAEELIAAGPLRPGEIFKADRVRKGLQNIRNLYDTKGYINFTAVPDTRIDEAARTIQLGIDVDEGPAYHVRKVQIVGLTAERTQQLLRGFPLKPGDVFRSDYVEAFYQQYRSLLPRGARPERNTSIGQNHDDHTVDILLDFRRQ